MTPRSVNIVERNMDGFRRDANPMPETCYYCGKSSSTLIEMGNYDRTIERNIKLRPHKICAGGTGCQTKYTPGWGIYLFGALHVDIPYLIVVSFLCWFSQLVFQNLNINPSIDMSGISLAQQLFFPVLGVIGALLFTFGGFPMFFSILALVSYTIYLIL